MRRQSVASILEAIVVSNPSSPIIVARNLTQRYPRVGSDGPLTVLDAVDLEVGAGERVAILGPSGSGKTTLLGLLAGLDLPTEGAVELVDQPLSGLDEDARAALRADKIGFVFQSFQLVATLTAHENVLVPLELLPAQRALDRRVREQRARSLLERVGLGDRLDHYPAQLSGGEQQRVGIARAFANEPQILFADEPTGNLDGETGRGVVELLLDLNRESGTTLVIVTHDIDLARLANRIVTLNNGRIESVERPTDGAAEVSS
ncbi:MAG: ABC transporter ATP-binding protein [bacterium]|nr:ABC transporter ATP-binding protein [bacterium]